MKYPVQINLLLLFILFFPDSDLFSQDNFKAQIILSPKEAKEDLNTLQVSLITYHPDLFLYSSREEFDAFFENAKANIDGPINEIEFFRMITRLLPIIANNHTDIVLPESYKNYLNNQAQRLPFSLYFKNDSFYVLEDRSAEYVIKEGAVIEKINGRKTKNYFDEFIGHISTDGHNFSQPALRASKGFSRYFGIYSGTPDVFEIEYLDSLERRQNTKIKALKISEFKKNRKNPNESSKGEYSFEIQNDIALLEINTFSISKHQQYKGFLGKAFSDINDQNIDKLIIDLRDNMGGFPEASRELCSYLIDEDIRPQKLEYALVNDISGDPLFIRDGYYKHFMKQKFLLQDGKYSVKGSADYLIKAKKEDFEGELIVLISANTSSTSGQLIGLLKSYTNCKFVGEESGGNPVTLVANDILSLKLPKSGILVKIPLIKSEMNVNFSNDGYGLKPDYEIRPEIDDILSGSDTVLEYAKILLRNKE